MRKKSDRIELWEGINARASKILGDNAKIETAESSPDGNHLAVCLEVKGWLGLKTRQAGFLYSIGEDAIDGRVVLGKRETKGWIMEKTI